LLAIAERAIELAVKPDSGIEKVGIIFLLGFDYLLGVPLVGEDEDSGTCISSRMRISSLNELNWASCPINWVGSTGSSGLWLFSCATSSFMNISLMTCPVLESVWPVLDDLDVAATFIMISFFKLEC
jgi:hypothetical protein